MKNYEQKECCNHHECPNKRFINHSYIDVNTKNKTSIRSRMKISSNLEKGRKLSPSITNARGHNSDGNQPSSKRANGHNNDKLLRPASCTCPHGHYYEEEVRPASCPNGQHRERKKLHASYTCANGHPHGPTINAFLPQMQSNRMVPTAESYARTRKYYRINVPREPLILPPTETVNPTKNPKESNQEHQKRSRLPSPQRKKIPFCKSYKNGIFVFYFYIYIKERPFDFSERSFRTVKYKRFALQICRYQNPVRYTYCRYLSRCCYVERIFLIFAGLESIRSQYDRVSSVNSILF